MSDSIDSSDSTASGADIRRALAAIVFTDVAGFSALMGQNEEHALKLVHRDLDLIRGICTRHEGRVLKSTGDGLLMFFDSAVKAVACALEAQKTLNEQAKTLPAEEILKHRIGIHLGDVFITPDDVMGDGVNVAARLQAESEPGGVCISQTVYDVVKNRLGIQATYLGPRELKNIQEAVPVYQILLEASGGTFRAKAKKKVANMAPWQWMVIGTIFAVVGLAVVLAIVVLRGGSEDSKSYVITGRVAVSSSQPIPAAMDPKVDAARRQYLGKYDFKGMSNWLAKNNLKGTEFQKRYDKLAKLKSWLILRLNSASKDDPVVVEYSGDQGVKKYEIYSNAEGSFNIKSADGVQKKEFAEIEPALMGRIVSAVLRENTGASSTNLELQEASRIFTEEFTDAGLIQGK